MNTHLGNYRAELLARREQLARRLDRRSKVEKALTDNDPFMLLVLIAAGAIWAVELVANLSTTNGWSGWVHLAVIGPMECVIVYLLFSAARAALQRRQLEAIDRHLRELTPL